jgi:dTDP-4-amino-4,6-dideoxygalactose transaminase
MKKNITFSKPYISNKELFEIKKTLNSGWLTEGSKNKQFENLFKKYLKTNFITTTSNATSALDMSIKLLNAKKRSEIITPSITWASAVNMIELNGYTPIFVDVDPETFNLDMEDVKKKISKNTAAIIPVHFAGQAYDIDKLKRIINGKKIKIIEDCSHAIGTFYKDKHVGTNADFAIFSFHPNKNITTAEGGLIICKNKVDFNNALKFKYHGLSNKVSKKLNKNIKKEVINPGMKYILSDIHASIGIAQFNKLNIILDKRKKIANRYINFLKNLKNISPLIKKNNYKNIHSWHLFIIKFNFKKLKINFNQILEKFSKSQINTGLHYYPVHLHKYYKKKYALKKISLPNTNNLKDSYVSLPLYPGLSQKDQNYICKVLKSIDIST